MTLVATCLTVLLVQLDTTVVNLALHAIQVSLAASVVLLQWIVDAYNLTYASLILTGGTLGDLFGRRRWLSIGIGVFILGSLVCAVSPSPTVLVVGRAVAGVGAALALPGSLSVLTQAYPDPHARARAVSVWAGINGLAIALGPVVGGALVDTLGWRSIFGLAVPVGILALLATRCAAESANPAGRRIDVRGQVLAALGLGCLAKAAIDVQSAGVPWLAAAVLLLTGFVAAEARTHGAMVQLDVLARKPLVGSLAVAVGMTFGMYGLLFLVPLFLQAVQHESAMQAGLALVPLGLVFTVVSPLAGRVSAHLGPRWLIAGGMALSATGLAAIAVQASILPALVVLGLALGLQTGPLMAVAVASVEPERSGMASGLINVARLLGATMGVAVLGSVFTVASGGAATPEQFRAGMRAALLVGALAELVGCLMALATIGRSALHGAHPRPARMVVRGHA